MLLFVPCLAVAQLLLNYQLPAPCCLMPLWAMLPVPQCPYVCFLIAAAVVAAVVP
jgi:hypothetical protein